MVIKPDVQTHAQTRVCAYVCTYVCMPVMLLNVLMLKSHRKPVYAVY